MVKVEYDGSYGSNFQDDVRGAVKFYLGLHDCDTVYGVGFILYPKALNPFLKIMESMGEAKNIVILPAFNHDNREKVNEPAYLILKIPESRYVEGLELV